MLPSSCVHRDETVALRTGSDPFWSFVDATTRCTQATTCKRSILFQQMFFLLIFFSNYSFLRSNTTPCACYFRAPLGASLASLYWVLTGTTSSRMDRLYVRAHIVSHHHRCCCCCRQQYTNHAPRTAAQEC